MKKKIIVRLIFANELNWYIILYQILYSKHIFLEKFNPYLFYCVLYVLKHNQKLRAKAYSFP